MVAWGMLGVKTIAHITLRVHVPRKQVLGILVIAIVGQDLGKFLVFKYLDP